MIAIIDYGVGNLFSLKCSLDEIGAEAVITGDADTIKNADCVILPGVGAFKDASDKLFSTGLAELLHELMAEGKPIMGICLGMQLLFERGFEYGENRGLGLLKGQVRCIKETIPEGLKVPHMGWNGLRFRDKANPLFRYIKDGDFVYFVHSYAAVGCEDSIIADTEYGAFLTAAVSKGSVFGCQFHPEKSGETGLKILKAFCEMGGKKL